MSPSRSLKAMKYEQQLKNIYDIICYPVVVTGIPLFIFVSYLLLFFWHSSSWACLFWGFFASCVPCRLQRKIQVMGILSPKKKFLNKVQSCND